MTSTGPPYPPAPVAGSNAAGVAVVGVSPIGTINPFVWWSTVISQYANSPRITAMIGNLAEYLDQTRNFDQFFDLIINVDTAQGYGLDVWGRRVGVNRAINVPAAEWFGFTEALPGSLSFNNGHQLAWDPQLGFEEGGWSGFAEGSFSRHVTITNVGEQTGGAFYSGAGLTTVYELTDETYRLLIMAKAAANITNGSIPAINQILLNLFPGRGNCYVQENVQSAEWFGFEESTTGHGFNEDMRTAALLLLFSQAPSAGNFAQSFYAGTGIASMSMTYVFEFPLSAVEYGIVGMSGVLPKSTGVSVSISVPPG